VEKIIVAAAVVRRDNKVLLCLRPPGKRHAGLWEFPGGKLQAGESLEDALRRELDEEVGVELVTAGATLYVAHDPGSPFEIHFIEAYIAGSPAPLEHERVEWVTIEECRRLALAPTDQEFYERRLSAPPAPAE
jgi:mutator protein MutT